MIQDSNLRQHMKVVHLEQKPFSCSFSGCGMRFGYRHVRDNHERSGHHVYINVSLALIEFLSFLIKENSLYSSTPDVQRDYFKELCYSEIRGILK